MSTFYCIVERPIPFLLCFSFFLQTYALNTHEKVLMFITGLFKVKIKAKG